MDAELLSGRSLQMVKPTVYRQVNIGIILAAPGPGLKTRCFRLYPSMTPRRRSTSARTQPVARSEVAQYPITGEPV